MSYKEDSKYFNERTLLKIKCKNCGHTQAIDNSMEKSICRWCRNYIFRNDEVETKYRLKEMILKERRKKNELV